jgi:hypothetical protein
MTHGTRRGGLTIVAAVGFAAGYLLAVRPRLLRTGATDGEVQGPYPGAGLIPDSTRSATMAVTIEAPRSHVWPWLVQMGTDRASCTAGTDSKISGAAALRGLQTRQFSNLQRLAKSATK